jgi:two-component system OmpR family sensor kinase
LKPLRSARARILRWMIVLLAASTVTSVVLIAEIQLVRLGDEVEEGLTQEASEFRKLVGGRDPRTGEPFGDDVAAIFDTYLRRNVPGDEEVLLTFDGRRAYKSSGERDYPIGELRPLYRDWTALTESRQGEADTSAGGVRYLAVPIVRDGVNRGTFVVLEFTRDERDEVLAGIRVVLMVSLGVLLLASLAAWLAAGRVLAPLRELQTTALAITETDLTRRIDVQGDDELADLGRAFNAMLDRLEAAFRSQRAFVDDASHELRTPITIVRGHLELMGDDPDERRQTVALVMDELDRMSRFVDDLLLLARSERGDFLAPEPLDLGELAVELDAKAHGLGDRDWRLERPAGPIAVVADRQRLTQAVMNLAGNAVQHTAPGDRITIGTGREDGEARLWVADSGPGIAREDRQRIFARFARGGAGPRRSDGAGLGLSIVSAIAEAHGGRVELESTVGHGATFTVVIPVRPPHDDASGQP